MQNWAIVVGINNYEHLPQNKHLKCAVKDAELVKAFLCENAGFSPENILLCSDKSQPRGSIPTAPTLTNLRRILLEEIRQADGADNFWFFFAGHGISRNFQDYLLPRDGYPYDEGSAIPIRFVIDCLHRCRAKNIVLILDMCREEKPQSPGSRGATAIGEETIKLSQQKGFISIFSCGVGEESYEIAELEQGAFTYIFLKGLEQNPTLRELEQYLIREVPALNLKFKKPIQVPLVKPEPGLKYDLPLFKELASQVEPQSEQGTHHHSEVGVDDKLNQNDKFSCAEITISRSNEGADDIWDLKIGGSDVPSKNKNIRIKKGEKVTFTLPSGRYYTMSLHFTRFTSGYSSGVNTGQYQVPARHWTHETIGVSNEWSGNFSPGKYYFECRPKLNLLYTSLKIVTLNNYDRAAIFLKMKTFSKW